MELKDLLLGVVTGFAGMLVLMWANYKIANHRRVLAARRTPFNRR